MVNAWLRSDAVDSISLMFTKSGSGRNPVAGSGALILRERNRCTPCKTEYSAVSELFCHTCCSMPMLACDKYGDRISGATRMVLGRSESDWPLTNGFGKEGLEITTSRSRTPSKRSDRSVADRGKLS